MIAFLFSYLSISFRPQSLLGCRPVSVSFTLTQAYEMAILHQPQYPEALVNLGVIHKNQGRIEDAIAYYEARSLLLCFLLLSNSCIFCSPSQRALQANKNFTLASRNLAIAYTDLGFYLFVAFLIASARL